MTTEEKAKAYDEAVCKMKEIITMDNTLTIPREIGEYLFPELKDPKDERIRKELIRDIDIAMPIETAQKYIAWLEKQGEQKPIDKIQLGKRYKCIASPRYSTFMVGEIYKPKDKFLCSLMNFCSDCFEPIKDDEQKPAFEMKTPEESLGIDSDTYNKIVDECIYGEQKPVKWSEKDEKMRTRCAAFLGYHYQGGIMTRKEYEEVHNWLESLKDRVQPQPKQEWGDEDETALCDALWCCKQAASIAKDENDMGNVWYAENWLRSLRPQNKWKPSDEQMKALNYVVNLMASSESPKENDYYYNVFKDLRNQLKKLREE